MMSFMFAVLGSFVFWGVFGLIGLIIGTMFLKRMAPKTWEFVTTGEKTCSLWWPDLIVILIVCYVFWPVVALGFGVYLFVKYVLKWIAWTPFCTLVKFIDKNTPTIDVKIKED